MKRLSIALLVFLVIGESVACHRNSGPESYVPQGTVVWAGVDVARLRASPLYPRLPAILQSFPDAKSLMVASNGKELLLIADGKLSGPPELVQAAEAQHRTGTSGAPDLTEEGRAIGAGKQVWIVVRGGTSLPLTGNAGNINRLLRDMEFAAVTIAVNEAVEIAVQARGRSAEAARHFEDTLRATLTMTAVGETKRPELATLLRSIPVRRQDRDVRASTRLPAEQAAKLLGMLE